MDDTVGLNIKSQMALIISKCETVTEKVEKLTEYKEEVVQEIDNVIDSIRSGYTYCEKCKKWYKNRAWAIKTKQEGKIIPCSSLLSLQTEAEISYLNEKVIRRYLECPVGHEQPYQRLEN